MSTRKEKMSVGYLREWDKIIAFIDEGRRLREFITMWNYDEPVCVDFEQNQLVKHNLEKISSEEFYKLTIIQNELRIVGSDEQEEIKAFYGTNENYIVSKIVSNNIPGNCYLDFIYASSRGYELYSTTMNLLPDIISCLSIKNVYRTSVVQLDNRGNLYISPPARANSYRHFISGNVESLFPYYNFGPIRESYARFIKGGKVYFLTSVGDVLPDLVAEKISERIVKIGTGNSSELYLTESGVLIKGDEEEENEVIETDVEDFIKLGKSPIGGIGGSIVILLRKHNDPKMYISKVEIIDQVQRRITENLPELEGLTFLPRMRNVKSARKLA